MTTTAPQRRPDRRRARHEAARQEILDVAWEMVRSEGLNSLSLRALARAVGIEPQSLYTYFPSKHAVYDAMFAEGNRELLRRMRETHWPDEPREVLRTLGELILRFDVEDTARCHLLFDRVIPGFEPSEDSYAVAKQALDHCVWALDRIGLGDEVSVDLLTSLSAGLSAQQRADDPGADRCLGCSTTCWDMFLDDALKRGCPVWAAGEKGVARRPLTASADPVTLYQ